MSCTLTSVHTTRLYNKWRLWGPMSCMWLVADQHMVKTLMTVYDSLLWSHWKTLIICQHLKKHSACIIVYIAWHHLHHIPSKHLKSPYETVSELFFSTYLLSLLYLFISQHCESLRMRVLSQLSLTWSPSYVWFFLIAPNFLFLFNTRRSCLTSSTRCNLFGRTSIKIFFPLQGPSHILFGISMLAELLRTCEIPFPYL